VKYATIDTLAEIKPAQTLNLWRRISNKARNWWQSIMVSVFLLGRKLIETITNVW
jgi:hypothetical protein